jgi:hypothetical protein
MRTIKEYERILYLWERGNNQLEVARLTGSPRGTIRDCIKRFRTVRGLIEYQQLSLNNHRRPETLEFLINSKPCNKPNISQAYAYLLGMYLGDGYINKEPRTYKIRISLDSRYPNIIESCARTIETILPSNKVYKVKKPYNCVEVCCYNNFWSEFFPQHGPGRKHTRRIVLESWQERIAEQFPLEFFRGLFHSDGCRSSNIVNGQDYPRYGFTNYSLDIKQLFSKTCDLLGVHWTLASNGKNVHIARRADVAFLDQHIGPKS